MSNRPGELRPFESLWLPGHSPVSGGRGQLDRQLEIRAALPDPPPTIAMHFLVDSYTRRGHYFDMESLGYVVLAAWRHDLTRSSPVKLSDPFRPASIWLTMGVSEEDMGLCVSEESPPKPEPGVVQFEAEVERPPTMSLKGTVLRELEAGSELDESLWLGLELTFGQGVDIGEFGFSGPIKPLIDATGPVLGRDRVGGPADHRLHDLRIRKDHRINGSVLVRFWYADE